MKLKIVAVFFLSLLSSSSQGMSNGIQPPAVRDVGAIAVGHQQGVPVVAAMGGRVVARINGAVGRLQQCGRSCSEGCRDWREGCRESWQCQQCGEQLTGCCQYGDEHCCVDCSTCCAYSCGLWAEALCEPRCRALRSNDAFRCGCVCSAKIICCPTTCPCSYCGYICEEGSAALCSNCSRYNWREFESLFYGQ